MKKVIFTLAILAILTACTPAAMPPGQSGPTPSANEPVSNQPGSVPTEQVATQPESSPVEQTPPKQEAQVSPTAESKQKEKKPDKETTPVARNKDKNPAPELVSSNPDFIATEILGRPTDTSVTVNVVPTKAMEIYYEFGTTLGEYNNRTSPQAIPAETPIETTLAGLQANTRYYYRIRYRTGEGDFTSGQEHSFMTQRAPGSTFTFDLQGDSHPERFGKQFDPTLYTHTLQSAAADQPDFYLTIGDDFSVDQLKTVVPQTVTTLYVNQRQYLGQVGAPVFLVNGNHEQASLANLNGTPDNVAVWAQNARNTYYPQPAPDEFYSGDAKPVESIGLLRDYYAFTWGDALFVVIDPYWHSPQTVDNAFGSSHDQKEKRDLWNITLGETQYQWFKHTLETNTAKYKFIFAHHVNGTGRGGIELANTYEWGDTAGLAAHHPGWDKTIHQLMVDNGVTIFFQGHDHIFARQELDGVIYQTLPEPANPNYTYENEEAFKSGDKFPNSGHVRVTVSPNGVSVDYIRSYLDKPDELAFSYTVQ